MCLHAYNTVSPLPVPDGYCRILLRFSCCSVTWLTQIDLGPQQIWYPLLWLAIIGSGGCVSGTNPGYSSSELARHFKLTKPKFVFVQDKCIHPVIKVIAECNLPPTNVFSISSHGSDASPVEGYRSWRTLLLDCECDWIPPTQGTNSESAQDRLAVYATTSGTTGLPKAAMIPHRYIVAQTAMLEGQFNARPYPVLSSCLPSKSLTDVFHSHHNSSVYLSSMRLRHLWPLSCHFALVSPPTS